MKYFRVGVARHEWHSWNVHSDEIVETHTEFKPYMKFGKAKTGISGRQTDPTPRSDRVKLRLVGTTERTVARAIKASGHQFVVKDRDGHPRGAFATIEEAEAKAADSDTVFDRIEGRNVRRKRGREDIPDPGVQTAQVTDQWTVGA